MTMIIRLIMAAVAASMFLIAPTYAVEPDGRPTIGLVLGGGAAKGLSHVGVLKVLEDNQIPVDVVAGTSFGAIVGSLYAAGYSADEIDEIARTLDWNSVFKDSTDRSSKRFRRKSDDFGFLTDLKITFDQGQLVLPAGLIEGQSLYLELSRLLTRAYATENFDQLPRPFRAVATDLSTGNPVIMGDGNLVSAVFASMAIPGFVPPVEREGLYLVDGAFSNNVPVNLARDMGADIVIVVEVGEGPRPAEELGNVVDVIRQLQILLTLENTKSQLSSVTDKDVLILPDLKGFGITSFGQADMIIDQGAEAANAILPSLERLKLGDAAWARYAKAQTSRDLGLESPRIDAIVIKQDTKLDDKILRTGLSAEIGELLDIEQLNDDIDKLYDDGVYHRINYELVKDNGKNVLEVSAKAKESADGFFRFGIAVDSNLEDESTFNLGVAYTKPQLNSWGAEFRGEVNIGNETNAIAEFYQPIGTEQDFFIEPSVLFSREKADFFDQAGVPRGRIKATSYGASLQGGYLLGRWGELRAGVTRDHVDVDLSDKSLGISGFNIEDTRAFARFTVDRLDDLSFPRHGEIFIAQYEYHDDFLGGEAQYEAYGFSVLKPLTFDRHTLLLNGQFSGASGPAANILGTTDLGGFFSLSGFSEGELDGRYAALASGTYYYRLNRPAPLFDAPVFVGASAEMGNVYQAWDDIAFDDVIYAGSVFAGLDSPLGPVFLGFGFNDDGRQSLYLKIGGFF